jgi:mannose-6-phosphate isomerase-like protein (cupin superfamily)
MRGVMDDFRALRPDEYEWITRPHEPGAPARHVAELSEASGMAQARGNLWRYEPGAAGRRHRHRVQEEVFVVVSGTLSMYLGEPPRREDVGPGGLVRAAPGTPLQTVNHGDADLLVYVHGWPGEDETAELLPSAV